MTKSLLPREEKGFTITQVRHSHKKSAAEMAAPDELSSGYFLSLLKASRTLSLMLPTAF
jgi:hypothetical protein